MPRTLARRRVPAPALIAIAFAFACAAAGPARAATYDITSCNADGTAAGWSSYGGASFQSGIVCPYNGDLTNRGLGVANTVNAGVIGYSGGGLMFKAPAGTSIAGIGTSVRIQRWDGGYWLGLFSGSGQSLYGFWANDGNGATAAAYAPHSWFNLSRESNVHLEVGCGGMCDTSWIAPAGFRAWAQMYDPITVRIEDDDAPAETLTGGGLLTNAYATGTQSVTYGATDASGIRATRLWVDGSKLRDDTRSCNFEQPVPCSNLSGAGYSVDTTPLADGPHTMKVETVDSAGNGAAQTHTITVDNHAPAAPSVSVAGGEGWRSTNGFTVSWTNPAGQVAPVAKARYQICRADQPSNCQPVGVQSGANISSLSALSVPGEGDYTLTVWLEDAAGNASAANSSAPVHLRYDASAPAQVSELRVAGGEGWRSANSFDLSWTNPDAQLSPITSAHYRLCDEDGTCTVGLRSEAAGINSIGGLSVPAAGAYTLAVWVGDDADNADPAHASAVVNLRFDDTDPGRAEPQGHVGWLGADDVANGWDLRVADEVTPPSGVAGFAVTVDGSSPGTAPNVGPDGLLHIADVPEGVLTVKARAISTSGVASASVGTAALSVDKTAPQVSVLGPPDPDRWQPAAVSLEISAADQVGLSGMEAGHVSYSVDGGPEQMVAGGTAHVVVGNDGEHTVTYRAEDAAGNDSAEHSVSLKLDTTPPGDVSLADPGGWLNVSSYSLPASLDDRPLSGLAGYSITTDGSFPDDTVDSIHLDSLPEGTTVVKARAVSGSGLASEHAASVALHVDRMAPEVRLLSEPDPERWVPDAVHLTVTGTDALSGMAGGQIDYSVDGADSVAVRGDTAEVDVSGNGRHTVRYRGVDAAGNRSEEKTAIFKIDEEKPGAAVPGSSAGWITGAGSYVEHVALGDGEVLPLSGLPGFSVTTDGSTPDDTPETGPDGVLSLDDLADGVTVVKARAVSGAGLASDVIGSGTIRVDRTPPLVALQRPAAGALVAKVSDATSGVARAELELSAAGADEWTRVPSELRGDALTARLEVERLAPGSYSLRATASDVAGNERVVSGFADGGTATLTVAPPASTPAAPGTPQVSAPPATQPVVRKAPVRCAAKSKRAKRSHRRRHRRRRTPRCGRVHGKGGEKHRHRHLGGKTHKPARKSAG